MPELARFPVVRGTFRSFISIMYRVASTSIDHRGRHVTEVGPWFSDYQQAQYWANLLRQFGYQVRIESQSGKLPAETEDQKLRDALSSLA